MKASLQKGHIRQRIFFRILIFDMPFSLYISQGVIRQQSTCLLSLREIKGLQA